MNWVELLLGGGLFSIVTLIAKELYDRKYKKAVTNKVSEETVSIQLANQTDYIKKIGEQSKLMKDLLDDAEGKTQRVRQLSETLDKTQKENVDLKLELDGKNYVIEYQKDERHEWMQTLKIAMEATAEQKVEINQLKQIQKEHTRQIHECEERDAAKVEVIKNFETRLNVMVGMLQKANLPLPEGFIWTNIAEHEIEISKEK